jgi:hypothetical protein
MPELDGHVPLDRDAVVGQRIEQSVEVGEQRPFV